MNSIKSSFYPHTQNSTSQPFRTMRLSRCKEHARGVYLLSFDYHKDSERNYFCAITRPHQDIGVWALGNAHGQSQISLAHLHVGCQLLVLNNVHYFASGQNSGSLRSKLDPFWSYHREVCCCFWLPLMSFDPFEVRG